MNNIIKNPASHFIATLPVHPSLRRLGLLLVLVMFTSGISQEPQGNIVIPNSAAVHPKYSLYYENLIGDVLAKYYPEQTFLVDAKVYVSGSNVLSPRGNFGDIRSLPGLPVLPDEFREGGGNNLPDAMGEGQWVDVEILVDTAYQDRDISFIKSLTGMAANLSDLRGDRLLVRKGVFPDGRKPGRLSAIPEAVREDALPPPQNTANNPYQGYIDNMGTLVPIVITFLFVVLLAWVLSRNLSGNKMSKQFEEERYKNLLQEIKNIQSLAQPKNGGDSAPKDPSTPLKSFAVNAFVGDPVAGSEVIKGWWDKQGEKATAQAAQLLIAAEPKLLTLLEADLPPDLYQALKNDLKNIGDGSEEDGLAALEAFRTDFIQLKNLRGNESEYKDLFGFLKQLSNHQILHLIKEESEGITGLVLAQLDANRAATVLQSIEKGKRTKVLAGMGKIENIPVKAYKQLADRLSRKAIAIANMRYVASDGVESLLDVLDNLPLDAQNEYLGSIAEVNLQLAEKIKERFITLPEVAELPDKFLQGIVNGLEQDTLALTLAHAEDNLKSKTLELLPERMRAMIESSLEGMQDEPPEKVESAQKKFLQAIRREIKLSGGRPS